VNDSSHLSRQCFSGGRLKKGLQQMEIVPVRPEHVEALHAVYLAQVADAPHCRFAPEISRFRSDLLRLNAQPTKLFHKPNSSQTFVAEAAGVAQGFATFVTYGGDDEYHEHNEEKQAITGLFFTNAEAGEALIRACEAAATASTLDAFPDTHGFTPIRSYNAAWDGLSDRVPGVAQLLARHGYIPFVRELHLVAPLLPSHSLSAPLPLGIAVAGKDWPAGAQEARVFDATDGEKAAGVALYCLLSQISDDPAAERIGYVMWLHVEETYRRRGIGRGLMAAAINEMVAQGCTECWLTTAADNWKAQALYYKLGFEIVDCSVSFRKSLDR
jgi:ribosomal protein S18 acetylase RimI-like enzyme